MTMNRRGKQTKLGYSFLIIPISIVLFQFIDFIVSDILGGSIVFVDADKDFLKSFFEGFSIIYAFSFPVIIAKTWDQFDKICDEFNKEAYAIRYFYKDVLRVCRQNSQLAERTIDLLHKYVDHIIANYQYEATELSEESKYGDVILNTLRQEYDSFIKSNWESKKDLSTPISEIITRVDRLINIRRNRVDLFQQSTFFNLRILVLITSILYVVPLSFVGFTSQSAILDNIIVVGVISLVIYVYIIVEDMDKPFDGSWRVNDKAWRDVLSDIEYYEREIKGENDAIKTLTQKPKENKPKM